MLEIQSYGLNVTVTTDAGETKSSSGRGYGGCRKVFLFDDFVIKFANGDEFSEQQNWNELDFYTGVLQKEDEKYFAKLLGYGEVNGELFLIQERVYDDESVEGDITVLEMLDEKYKLANDVCLGGGWSTRKNCAMTSDGELKIFDVGYREANKGW